MTKSSSDAKAHLGHTELNGDKYRGKMQICVISNITLQRDNTDNAENTKYNTTTAKKKV